MKMTATTKIVVNFPVTAAGWLAVDLIDAERSLVLRPNRGDVYVEQGQGRNRVRNRSIKLHNVLRFAATEVSLTHERSQGIHEYMSAVQISLLHSVPGPDKIWLLDLGTTATPLIADLLLPICSFDDIKVFCNQLARRAYEWVSQANALVLAWREEHLASFLAQDLPADFSTLRSTINDVSGAATAAAEASNSSEIVGHLDQIHMAINRETVVLDRLQQGVANVLKGLLPGAIDLAVPKLQIKAGALPRPSQILVVDDDEGTRKMLTTLLAKHNFKVYGASCVEEAVVIARETPLDLVLLDLGLPDHVHGVVHPLGGLEVVAAIQQSQADRPIRIVVITGQAFGEVRDAVERRGLEIVTKPFDDTFISKIIPNA